MILKHKFNNLKLSTKNTILSSNKINIENKINLLNFDRKYLYNLFSSLGEPSFRVNQIMKWIYHYCCDNFDKMTNINKNLIKILKEKTKIYAPKIVKEYHSKDGTIKWIIKIDNQKIETIYIPEKNRSTLCISSQIGCPLNCSFCFTAKQGFNRNLQVFEIIGQVWIAVKTLKTMKNFRKNYITNIVIMGMGEPLLNLKNIVSAIKIMIDDFGYGISKRKIILSTSGIVPALKKLNKMIDISLAISLHAPNNYIRNKIMPINLKYNIEKVLSSALYYLKKTTSNKRFITIEYVMLDHFNDSIENAHELSILLKKIPCKINLIPWNPFINSNFKCSSNNRINNFAKIMIKNGFITTIRKIRGRDINASCGQLSGEVINKIKNI